MSLQRNLESVQQRIARAAKKSGRNPEAVHVVAVTKTWPAEKVLEARSVGLHCFGENYVQEALPKIQAVSAQKAADASEIHWHFIGHLQSNKVKSIIGKFDLIHSIDRESVVRELAKRSSEVGKAQKILIEVNLAGEASKSGVGPDEVAKLLHLCQEFPLIQVQGLMFMPPLDYDEVQLQHYFEQARRFRDASARELENPASFVELSMGTSHDFEIAIEHGATLVRLGTVLFGAREK